MEEKKRKNYLLAFWRVVYPLILYFAISIMVQIPFTIFYSIQALQEAGDDLLLMQELLMKKSMENALQPMLIAILIAMPIIFFLMKKDKKKLEADKDKASYVKATALQWTSVAILAVAFCIGGNNLINFSRIIEIFPGFQEISEMIYSGGIILQVLVVGIAAPIIEEMLFRGLVHNRIKEYSNVKVAILLSALTFGIYHMNMVQAIYAFGLGILLSYIYEKFKTIWAPILFHIVANCASIALVSTGASNILYENDIFAWIITVVCAVVTVGALILVKQMKLEMK